MIALCFFILPFTYFYSEEALEGVEGDPFFEDDSEDEDTKKERCMDFSVKAFK